MSPLDSCPFHAPVTMFNDAVIAMRTGLVSVPLTSLCVPQRVKSHFCLLGTTPQPHHGAYLGTHSRMCVQTYSGPSSRAPRGYGPHRCEEPPARETEVTARNGLERMPRVTSHRAAHELCSGKSPGSLKYSGAGLGVLSTAQRAQGVTGRRGRSRGRWPVGDCPSSHRSG